MEEVNPSQSADAEQTHAPVNHNRPFFYVQPPSQPYFMYQWPMEPFGQYGFPGPVFPFGRPYMAPYQYMQYPGYVVPHAPMQPTEYRRVAPFLPSVASYDLRFRQHFQQMSMHREMTSAEAQTESVDQVVKLMDSLSHHQTCEKPGNLKEQNMISSTPDVTSCPEVENLHLEPVSQPEQDDSAKPSTLGDSAVSSHGRLEECVLSDVLPLDSSSIHEENQDQDDQRCLSEAPYFERRKAAGLAGDVLCHEGSTEGHDSGAHVSDLDDKSDACGDEIAEQVENLLPESVEVIEPAVQTTTDYDLPYQILHLPSEKAATGLFFQKAGPIMSMDAASALLPSKGYSFGGAYLYSYYPQVAPERQSVLSPSLDELSSKDEMFSTDVEDDLSSGQVHVDGGKLETSSVPTGSEMEPKDEACSVCACCGASLPDEDENASLPERCGYLEKELAQDCECDFLEEDAPSSGDARKPRQQVSRQTLPPCGQQAGKHKARKVPSVDLTGQCQAHGRGECGEQVHAAAKTERAKAKGQKYAQSRYSEHFQREGPGELLDQENWASANGKQRSKSCRPNNGLQEKGRPARRRPSCKMFAPQRPRRNEYDDHDEAEFSYCQRGRGTMRRGTRY